MGNIFLARCHFYSCTLIRWPGWLLEIPILLRDCTNPGDMHTSNEWVLEGMCFRTRVPLCESYHLRNHSTTDKGAVKARLGRPCRTDIPDNFTSILYYPASPALVPNPHGMGFIFNELLHTGAPFLLGPAPCTSILLLVLLSVHSVGVCKQW